MELRGARGEIEVPPATITVWGCSVGTGTVKIKHQGRTIGTHTIMVLARTVSFSASSYSVTEGGSVGIRVTMSPAANRDYTIPITVTRRTAESTDYSVLGLPAVFNGESQGTSHEFTITARQDTDRDDETLELGFGRLPTGVASGSLSMATLTITDDDPDEVDGRTVSFSAERYPGSEGSNVSVTVNMSPAADGKYTIPITASDNTNHSVTFSSGDESASFDYPAGQNSLCDLNPDVTLDFGASLPSGVEEGSRSTATVTIANDDTCKVQFSPSTYSVNEGSSRSITVTLSGSSDRSLAIPITASQGSGGSVTFSGGSTSRTFNYRARQDPDCDNETVTLGFGNLPQNVETGSRSSATVTIRDDETCKVQFSPSTYSVNEGSSRSITVTLSGSSDRSLAIPITASQGSGGSVTFSGGSTSRTFNYRARQDPDCDNETVTLGFGNLPQNVETGSRSSATVTIRDDETCKVQFSPSTYSVNEGSSRSITVTLSGSSSRSLVIPITASQGSGGSVTFSGSSTPEEFEYRAGQNTNCDDATVTLGFGDLPENVVAGSQSTATVTIRDDDCTTQPSDPLAPTDLTHTSVGTSWVALSWSTASSGIDKHRVRRGSSSSGPWTTVSSIVSGTAERYTVRSLSPNTTYYFQVAAYGDGTTYKAVWSSWSSSASTTTLAAPVPGKVSLPSVTPGDRSLVVSWTAPNDGGSPITGYRVQRKLQSASWPPDSVYQSAGGSARSTTIPGLINGSTYDVQVRACNDDGCGPWSDPAFDTPRTTPGRVSVPTLVGIDGGLRVDWVKPPDDGGAAIARYQIRYKITTASDLSWVSGGTTNFLTTEKTITNLTNGTVYDVQVRACNIAGCGTVWSESATEAAGIRLAAPTNLDVEPRPERKARLTWTSSANADSDTEYDVYAEDPTGVASFVASTTNSSPWVDITLDAVFTYSGVPIGLANREHFKLWVVARDTATQNPVRPSLESTRVIIVENPIVRADGSSPNTGQGKAEVEWETISNIEGTEEIRFRRLEGDRDHSDIKWGPGTYSPWLSPDNVSARTDHPEKSGRRTATILGLTQRELYGIQLNYNRRVGGEIMRTFAAREVYVWPSDRAAGMTGEDDVAQRVATFPLRFNLPDGAYEYVLCADTFSEDEDEQDEWREFVAHAFGQWTSATDHQIAIKPSASGDCSDYSIFVDMATAHVESELPDSDADLSENIEQILQDFLPELKRMGFQSTRNNDLLLSEVIGVRDTPQLDSPGDQSSPPDQDIEGTGDAPMGTRKATIFVEIARFVAHGACRDEPCAITAVTTTRSGIRVVTTDILVPKALTNAPNVLSLPESDIAKFNACEDVSELYRHMVHEVGHALGISDHRRFDDRSASVFAHIEDSNDRHHSLLTDSIVSYEIPKQDWERYGCSPHPFDILAIYALYQTLDRSE